MKIRFTPAALILALTWPVLPSAAGTPVAWNGSRCELSINRITPRTVQVVLAPLDADGNARPLAPTAAFVHPTPVEVSRTRTLDPSKDIEVGDFRFRPGANWTSLAVRRADGRPVQELEWKPGEPGQVRFRTPAPVFGLGEGEQQFDRRGGVYLMVNGQLPPMQSAHGATVPVPFLIGTDGWALFFRGPWGQFDLRDGRTGYFMPNPHASSREPLVMYLTAWDDPTDVPAEFIHLTGRPTMPPKWAMGYMQSHRTLPGRDGVMQIAKRFRDSRLPVDAMIYLGTGYCPQGWNTGHGSLKFHPGVFPDPAGQIKELHDLNLKVVLHVNHPNKQLSGTSFEEKSDSPWFIRHYWKRHETCMKLGVDGWWPDDGNDLSVEACIARHAMYHEGPLHSRPNVRPWHLQRNAYAGVARFGGWLWSGDTDARWKTLARHVAVGLNSSLSVTPFWGSDIGGFYPTEELTGELFVRWFQFGAFNPSFRSHGIPSHVHFPWGWNTGETGPPEGRDDRINRAELRNAQVEPLCRQYLELRYRLLPYNYSLMRQTVDSGVPAMRPLWMHYHNDAEAIVRADQFLWGRDMLIAPVVEKGVTGREVYLPAGRWYDWWSGERIDGGRKIQREVDLATMPIYVRAGAILPLDPVRQYTAEAVDEPTVLRIHGGADGRFMLYDDDGVSLDYLKGVALGVDIHWDDTARKLSLRSAEGPGLQTLKEPRAFRIELLPEKKSQDLVFSGEPVGIAL